MTWYAATRIAYESVIEAFPQVLLQTYIFIKQKITRTAASYQVNQCARPAPRPARRAPARRAARRARVARARSDRRDEQRPPRRPRRLRGTRAAAFAAAACAGALLVSLLTSTFQLATKVLIGSVRARMNPIRYLISLGGGLPVQELAGESVTVIELAFLPSGSPLDVLCQALEQNKSMHTLRAPSPIGELVTGSGKTWDLGGMTVRDVFARSAVVRIPISMLRRVKLPAAVQINGVPLPVQDLSGSAVRLVRKRLGPVHAASVGEMLEPSTSVKSLDLSKNKGTLGKNPLGGVGVEVLLEVLGGHGTLETLKLDQCDVGDPGAALLAKMVRSNAVLHELSLARNHLRHRGASALGDAVAAEGCGLRTLTLGREPLELNTLKGASSGQPSAALNKPTDLDAIVAAKLLAPNKTTSQLYIHDSQMSSGGYKLLARLLRTNDSLREMHVPADESARSLDVLADAFTGDSPFETLYCGGRELDVRSLRKGQAATVPSRSVTGLAARVAATNGSLRSLSFSELDTDALAAAVPYVTSMRITSLSLAHCGLPDRDGAMPALLSIVRGAVSLQQLDIGETTSSTRMRSARSAPRSWTCRRCASSRRWRRTARGSSPSSSGCTRCARALLGSTSRRRSSPPGSPRWPSSAPSACSAGAPAARARPTG